MRNGRYCGIVLGGGHEHRSSTHVNGEISDPKHRVRVCPLPHDHPGAAHEQVGVCSDRPGAFAPGHGVGADITTGAVAPMSPHLRGDAVLDGCDIGDDSAGMSIQFA